MRESTVYMRAIPAAWMPASGSSASKLALPIGSGRSRRNRSRAALAEQTHRGVSACSATVVDQVELSGSFVADRYEA